MTVPRYRRLLPLCFTLAWGACPLAPAVYAQVQPVTPQLSAALPQWAQLMYAPDPDPGAVAAAYEAYYAAHPFEKNAHTQFYKRWKRELGHALVPIDPTQRATYAQDLRRYLDATDALRAGRAANWSCIGPFDWDHGAASPAPRTWPSPAHSPY